MTNLEQLLKDYQPTGQRLPIYKYPSAVLSKKALAVESFDDELHELCVNLLFTMYNAPGIGLAAPQVGVSKRLFVMDIDFDREEITKADGSVDFKLSNFNPQIFINPVIKPLEGEILYEEGCLSLPGQYEEVKRVKKIQVDYQDINGNHHSLEADDLLSVCIQHETDHLEGIVFIDRLSFLKKDLIRKKILKEQKRKQF